MLSSLLLVAKNKLAKRPSWEILIPFLVFLLLHAARPFLVGFFHDDWSIFVEPNLFSPQELLDYSIKSYSDRPILGLIFYIIASLWNGSPEIITLLSSAFVALSAIFLYVFLSRIVRLSSRSNSAPALITAAWIAIPWGFGYSLWPTGAMTLAGMIFFLGSSILLIDYMTQGTKYRLGLSLLALMISYLTYQANYLGFLGVIALTFALHPWTRSFYRRVSFALAGCLGVQILALIQVLLTTNKHTGLNPKLLLVNFIYSLPRSIHEALGEYVFLLLFIITALCFFSINEIRKHEPSKRRRLFFALVASFGGIIIGTLPFSLSGYGLQGIGIFSRTTVGTNLWLAVFLTVITLPLAEKRSAQKWMDFALISVLLILTTASIIRIQPWIQSWNRQKIILANFPLDSLKKMSPKDVVILNEPLEIMGITVFGAPWDITCAVYSRPEMRNLFSFKARPRIVPFYTDLPMVWNQETKSFAIRPGWETPADEVWIYTPAHNDLRKVTEGGTIKQPVF